MITDSIGKRTRYNRSDNNEISDTGSESSGTQASAERFSSVLACIDGTDASNSVIPYAYALSVSLHTELQLLTVLEADYEHDSPSDPVEWSLRRRETENHLSRLINDFQLDKAQTSINVLEGKSTATIRNCLTNSQREITAFCRKDDHEPGHIGATSRSVLEHCAGSMLIVPARKATSSPVRFQRIMVPLDGSARAESVLPIISKMAQFCKATVVIVHATANTRVPELVPGDSKSACLRAALDKHNQSAAQQYLERISRRLHESGVQVELQALAGDDPRRQLIDAVVNQSIDLVVLSSHGVSGHVDAPLGDVANHVMARSPVPALMLRDPTLSGAATVMDGLSPSAGRAPAGAD